MPGILAIGAHPDDVEVGCGGWLQKVDESHVVILTNGSAGGHSSQRVIEAQCAASLLSSTFSSHDLEDTNICLTDAVAIIEEEIQIHDPDIILTMCKHDTHQDHRATCEATKIATRDSPRTTLSYSGPSCLRDFCPSWFVPLTMKELDVKLSAIAAHKTQQHRQYLCMDNLITQARYWAATTRSSHFYVEPYELIEYWNV